MDDALLTSLCKICHIDPPKYTCPRCLAETCSLTCSKRHKVWASCNGVRDPTVYKPISEVATPSGIDHDYNFIHSIEHGISRSEKVLIEDLGLVTHEELKRARMGEDAEPPRKRSKANEPPGEVCIRKVLETKQITVHKAPRGMRRNQENTTSWSRKRKTIDWQVEWFRAAPVGRTLYKVSGAKLIGDQYDALCDEERRMNMTPDERREDNKKKASEGKIRAAQRRIADSVALFPSAPRALLQDPATGAWQLAPKDDDACDKLQHPATPTPVPRNYHLYFHRPLTPASFPKVLVHLDLAQPLTDLLAHRELLEYPTIYVLEQDPLHLPSQFMREEDFLAATGGRRAGDPGARDEEESSSSSDSSESGSSSEEEAEVEKKDEI